MLNTLLLRLTSIVYMFTSAIYTKLQETSCHQCIFIQDVYTGIQADIYICFQLGNNLNSSGKIFLIHFQIKKRCNIKRLGIFLSVHFCFGSKLEI